MSSKLLIGILLSVLASGVARASQFNADIRMVQQGNAIEGKFFARDSVYRIDMKATGPTIYVTVDERNDTATVFNVKAHQYMRLPVAHPQIIKTDPIQMARVLEKVGAVKNYQGVDTLEGLACDRYLYLRDGKPSLKMWVSRHLAFPIKIENATDTSTYMELVDIREKPQDDSLFAVPAGFSERERPEPKRPPNAPPPREVKEGTKLRLPLNPSKIAVVRLVNTAAGASTCRLTFFRNGAAMDSTRTGGYKRCVFSFAAQGDKNGRSYDTGADEILIAVSKGAVSVEIDQ